MSYSTGENLLEALTLGARVAGLPPPFSPRNSIRLTKRRMMPGFISLELTGDFAPLESRAVPPQPGGAFVFRAQSPRPVVLIGETPVTSPLLPTYARADVSFEKGEGPWLFGRDGERYLDFGAGIAVNALGHAHPAPRRGPDRAGRQGLAHLEPLSGFRRASGSPNASSAATFADVVFFSNSGAEANEAAIKMARKYHAANGQPERFRIVTFEGAFHGRTLATIAAGGQQKYLEGFGPKVEGFDQVDFGDRDALEAAITPETAAILIEPIQGEGGIRPVPTELLRAPARASATSAACFSIFDEIQTGVGRTGKLFAYEWAGIAPDIMSIAKGIGGGFPLGACLATAEAAKGMTVGTHGTTFGGNPLAMAVGNAVLDVVLAPGFLEQVQRVGLLPEAASRGAEGPPPGGDRGGARPGPDDGPARPTCRTPISSPPRGSRS